MLTVDQATKNYPILRFFAYKHLRTLEMREMSEMFHDLAWFVARNSPMNAETSTALRKILEAKDCAVRSILPEETT